MKKNFVSLLVVLLSMGFVTSCITTSNNNNGNTGNTDKKSVVKAPALKEIVTEVFDVNNGSIIGECSITETEVGLDIELVIGSTQAITSYDGTFDLKEYSGTFLSLIQDEKTEMYLINSEQGADKLYAVIHENNLSYKFIFDEEKPDNKNVYFVTVIDRDTYDVVFDATGDRYNPSFTIHALKPYIVSQGAIVIESNNIE